MGDVSATGRAMLRPLGFGELFDRAITLYVRNFVPLVGIMLVLLIPWAVVQYFVDANQLGQLSQVFTVLQHPGAAGKAPPIFPYSPGELGVIVVAGLVLLAMLPFALNAVALAVARIYVGEPVDVRACYAASLARWGPTIGLIFLVFFMLIAWYIALVISVMILAFAGVAAFAVARPVGIVIFVFLGAVVLAFLALLAVLSVSFSFAMYAVVIERRSATEAIGLSFSRVFNRTEFWRTLLFALCAGAIAIGGVMVLEIVMFLALWLHQVWLIVVITTLSNAVTYAFSVVLAAVYYYDVRVRREGLDMQVGLADLVARTAPA